MAIQFKRVWSLLTVAATLSLGMGAAEGQPYGPNSIPQQFDDAYYDSTGDFHRVTSVRGQLSVILGVGVPWRGFNTFPETQISEDGQRVHDLYQRTMYQQVSGDRILRTPDLINPFDTSIVEVPSTSTTLPNLGNQAQGVLGVGQAVPFFTPGMAPGMPIAPAGFAPGQGVPGNTRFIPGVGFTEAAPNFAPTAQPYFTPGTSQVGSEEPPVRGLW